MRRILAAAAVVLALATISCERAGEETDAPEAFSDESFERPAIGITRGVYMCQRLKGTPVIDGMIGEEEWQGAEWTEDFVDIETGGYPPLRTRARMAWDDDYLYIAAKMEEPHVWANLSGRDADIWHDNGFQIFIDPDGDTHEYYEIGINALATVLDLLLVKPYRDGGPALRRWDIAGLKTGVSVEGTLNDPGDRDTGWEIEAAIPWQVLAECANRAAPPSEGDVWRMNLSRINWKTVVEGGRYVKATDPETGRPWAENSWAWSPQGLSNMHYPEMWGYVLFTNAHRAYGGSRYEPGSDEKAWDALREIYYAQKTYHMRHGRFADNAGALGLETREIFGHDWPPVIEATTNRFEARLSVTDGGWKQITEDGRSRTLE
jgi:hypothetical protein